MSFFQDMFVFEFLKNAFFASILVSILTALFSTVVVLRKIEFIGDGAAHASFGGLALGFLIGISSTLVAAISAVAFAITISYFSQKRRVSENSMIGILLPLSMALGVIFLSFVKGYTPDVMSYLFGNILLVSKADVVLLLILVVIAVLFFSLFHREIVYYSFDEKMAKHFGVNTGFIHYSVLIGISLSIVASVKIAGIILVTAFLVTPAATAKLMAKTFKGMVTFAIGLSIGASFCGMILAYYLNIPPGSAIVVALFVEFLVIYSFTKSKKA
ncbi:MAG: metal ABC transporter permease [Thermotogae bacterium]|nr:metal ABC transporter permease [Kosmotoga sp.]MBO8166410.1 metal ABC transporter permease [Kosmotoga sp.]RKX48961.1 MAG: metal ABC transporter permease [Thermotogota bacterium]